MKKRILTFVVTVLAGAMVPFTACAVENNDKTNENQDPPYTSTDPTPVEPTPVDPTPVDPTPAIPVEEFNEFVANMSVVGNYTFSKYSSDGQLIGEYNIDGDSMVVFEDGNRGGDYYMWADGIPYKYIFESKTGMWTKYYADAFDTDDVVLSDLNGATIIGYENGQFSANIGSESYTVRVGESEMELTNSNGESSKVYAVGSTKVSLPNKIFIVDGTENQPRPDPTPVDPTPDQPTPVEGTKVYTIDANGNRVYDSKVLADVVVTALNSTKEGDSKNVLASITSGAGNSAESVKYTTVSDGVITVGATLYTIEVFNHCFAHFKIEESSMASVENDRDKWISYIVDNKNVAMTSPVKMEYTSDDATYGDKVTSAFENVADKLSKNGVQARSIYTLGDPIEKLAGSKTVFAYTVENKGSNVGFDMGVIAPLQIYGVLENGEGNFEYLEAYVAVGVSDIYTPLERIAMNDNNGRFIVYKLENNKEVNKDLYQTSAVVSQTVDLYDENEGKGLSM